MKSATIEPIYEFQILLGQKIQIEAKICKINMEVFYEKKLIAILIFFSFFCVKKIPFLVQKFNLEKLNLIFISQFLAGKFK